MRRKPIDLDDDRDLLTFSDPSCYSAETISPWRFMVAAFVAISVVTGLLVALLAEGTP